MVSTSVISSDANTIKSLFKQYVTAVEEVTAAEVWEGISCTNFRGKASEFFGSFPTTIENQMAELSTAVTLFQEYKEYKNQKKSLNSRLSMLTGDDDRAERVRIQYQLRQTESKMSSLKTQIETTLSSIKSKSLQASAMNYGNAASVILGDSSETKQTEEVVVAEPTEQDEGSVSTDGLTKYSSGYVSPLKNMSEHRITSPFGNRKKPSANASSFHRGLDIKASTGEQVHSTADGKVVYAGSHSLMGNYVKIKQSDGTTAWYEHLNSYSVKEGDTVKQGEVIGEVGSTGESTGSHLHYGVQDKNGNYIDPAKYVFE